MNQRQQRWHDGTMAADGHRLADGRWQMAGTTRFTF
jgi:hypothetical protein